MRYRAVVPVMLSNSLVSLPHARAVAPPLWCYEQDARSRDAGYPPIAEAGVPGYEAVQRSASSRAGRHTARDRGGACTGSSPDHAGRGHAGDASLAEARYSVFEQMPRSSRAWIDRARERTRSPSGEESSLDEAGAARGACAPSEHVKLAPRPRPPPPGPVPRWSRSRSRSGQHAVRIACHGRDTLQPIGDDLRVLDEVVSVSITPATMI